MLGNIFTLNSSSLSKVSKNQNNSTDGHHTSGTNMNLNSIVNNEEQKEKDEKVEVELDDDIDDDYDDVSDMSSEQEDIGELWTPLTTADDDDDDYDNATY